MRAAALVRSGKVEEAQPMYLMAARLELEALGEIDNSKARTIGILGLSLVSQYYKAGALEDAKAAADSLLARTNLPAFAVKQIDDLVGLIQGDSDLQASRGAQPMIHGVVPEEIASRILQSEAPTALRPRKHSGFSIRIPRQAFQIPLQDLSLHSRQELTGNFQLLSGSDSVYQIEIGLQVIDRASRLNRRRKKNSLRAADNVYVRLESTDNRVLFIGHAPPSTAIQGREQPGSQRVPGISAYPGSGKTGFVGSLRNLASRSNRDLVSSSRNPHSAAWSFHKRWIEEVNDYNVILQFVVDGGAVSETQTIRCTVAVTAGARELGYLSRNVEFQLGL